MESVYICNFRNDNKDGKKRVISVGSPIFSAFKSKAGELTGIVAQITREKGGGGHTIFSIPNTLLLSSSPP